MWVEQGVGASEATDLALRNPSRLQAAYVNRVLNDGYALTAGFLTLTLSTNYFF
jgi:hypothetical protein